MKASRFALTALFLAALTLAASPAAALNTGFGSLKKAKFLSETTQAENTSSNWMDAFDTNIKLSGAGDQCLEIRFSTGTSLSSGTGGAFVNCIVLPNTL